VGDQVTEPRLSMDSKFGFEARGIPKFTLEFKTYEMKNGKPLLLPFVFYLEGLSMHSAQALLRDLKTLKFKHEITSSLSLSEVPPGTPGRGEPDLLRPTSPAIPLGDEDD